MTELSFLGLQIPLVFLGGRDLQTDPVGYPEPVSLEAEQCPDTALVQRGAVMLVDGVFTYKVNDAGKVLSLRAHWELSEMKAFPPREE